MRKIILSIVVTLTAFPALSECFSFGANGPSAVGEVDFKGYTATKVCHATSSSITGNGQYDVLVFSDNEGTIMQLTVEVSTARCPGYCKGFKGLSGNSLGENLTESEAKSIDVHISEHGGWSYQDHLPKQTFEVQLSN